MAADKSISDIDLAEFQTPNRRASGLIKGAEAFHRISDEPEPEDAYMPARGLSPIKEYVEGKSGMLSIPDPKKIFTKCLDMIGGEDAVVTSIRNETFQESVHQCMDKDAEEDRLHDPVTHSSELEASDMHSLPRLRGGEEP